MKLDDLFGMKSSRFKKLKNCTDTTKLQQYVGYVELDNSITSRNRICSRFSTHAENILWLRMATFKDMSIFSLGLTYVYIIELIVSTK